MRVSTSACESLLRARRGGGDAYTIVMLRPLATVHCKASAAPKRSDFSAPFLEPAGHKRRISGRAPAIAGQRQQAREARGYARSIWSSTSPL
jgi:hypothetical protein